VHCSVLQCVAVCCSVLQCVAVCCSVLRYGESTNCCHPICVMENYFALPKIRNETKLHTTTCYNTLQHSATHCNTLQHTATHCNTLQHTATHHNAWRTILRHPNYWICTNSTLWQIITKTLTLQHTLRHIHFEWTQTQHSNRWSKEIKTDSLCPFKIDVYTLQNIIFQMDMYIYILISFDYLLECIWCMHVGDVRFNFFWSSVRVY